MHIIEVRFVASDEFNKGNPFYLVVPFHALHDLLSQTLVEKFMA